MDIFTDKPELVEVLKIFISDSYENFCVDASSREIYKRDLSLHKKFAINILNKVGFGSYYVSEQYISLYYFYLSKGYSIQQIVEETVAAVQRNYLHLLKVPIIQEM